MTTYTFRFSDSDSQSVLELPDICLARADALALASARFAAEPAAFWNGESVAVEVSSNIDGILFTVIIAVIHGGVGVKH